MRATELPPAPGKRVYGEQAQAEARRLLRLTNFYGLPPNLKAWLCSVAKARRPLSYKHWRQITAWQDRQAALFRQHGWPVSAAGKRMYRAWKLAQARRVMRVKLPGVPY